MQPSNNVGAVTGSHLPNEKEWITMVPRDPLVEEEMVSETRKTDDQLVGNSNVERMSDADDWCPTCGRTPWIDGGVPLMGPLSRRHSWPWLFIVIGLCVVLAWTGRIWQSSEVTPSPTHESRCALARAIGEVGDGACAQALRGAGLVPRSLAVIAVAGVMVVLGVVQLTRQARRGPVFTAMADQPVAERRSKLTRAIAKVAGVLAIAEVLLVPCFQALMAMTTAYLIAALVRGGSSPSDALNLALDHTIDVVALASALFVE
jgi:hypothetical protein